MFELLFGIRPFKGVDHDDLVENILNQDISATIPSNDLDDDLIDCLTGVFHFILSRIKFLTRDIKKRLGTLESGGYEALRKHPFFSTIDWARLEKKEFMPPFVPESRKANCDATFELDGLLLDDSPLQGKPKSGSKSKNSKSSGNIFGSYISGGKRTSGPLETPMPKLDLKDPEVAKYMELMKLKFTDYDHKKAEPWKANSTLSLDKEEIVHEVIFDGQVVDPSKLFFRSEVQPEEE